MMKKLSKIQVIHPAKNLDDFLKKQMSSSLSDDKMNELMGGVDACDAVCTKQEMGGTCPCHTNLV